MADFSINDEQFQKVIAHHILESISQERKDQLVSEALGFLMKPTDSGYGRTYGPSPLARAFHDEVVSVAKNVVSSIVHEDAILKIIESTIEQKVREWVKSRDYDIAPIVSEAIRQNLEISINRQYN